MVEKSFCKIQDFAMKLFNLSGLMRKLNIFHQDEKDKFVANSEDLLTSNNKTLKLLACYTLILKCSFACSFLKKTKPKWKQSTVTVTNLWFLIYSHASVMPLDQ